MRKYELKKKAVAPQKDVILTTKKYIRAIEMAKLRPYDTSFAYMNIAAKNWRKAMRQLTKAEIRYSNYLKFLRNLRTK